LSVLVGIAAAFLLPGCSDDTSGPENGVDIEAVASIVAGAANDVIVQNEIARFLEDLSGTITPLMAPGGSASLVDVEGASAGLRSLPSLAYVRRAMSAHPSSPRFLLTPLPPLGTTCVWNIDTSGWVGGEPVFGNVPEGAIRWELYETEGGLPVIPLQPLDAYTDMFAGPQAEESNEVDALVSVTDHAVTSQVMTIPIDGTFESESVHSLDVRNATITGILDDLNFDADVDDNESLNIRASYGNALDFTDELTLGTTGLLLRGVDSSDPTQNISFDLEFDPTTLMITSGVARVDGQTVADASGTLVSPVFSLSDGSPLPGQQLADLEAIYSDAAVITGSAIEFVLLAACVGTDDPTYCSG